MFVVTVYSTVRQMKLDLMPLFQTIPTITTENNLLSEPTDLSDFLAFLPKCSILLRLFDFMPQTIINPFHFMTFY